MKKTIAFFSLFVTFSVSLSVLVILRQFRPFLRGFENDKKSKMAAVRTAMETVVDKPQFLLS